MVGAVSTRQLQAGEQVWRRGSVQGYGGQVQESRSQVGYFFAFDFTFAKKKFQICIHSKAKFRLGTHYICGRSWPGFICV